MQEIEALLTGLIGEPLSDMWRYAGRQVVEFGEQTPFVNRKGTIRTRANESLIISCDWQIWEGAEVCLASHNFTPERRDGAGHDLYKRLCVSPPLVETIRILDRGILRIVLSQGYRLEITPRGRVSPFEGFLDSEEWRFLTTAMVDQLVCTSVSYEIVPSDSFTALVASAMQARKPETITSLYLLSIP